MSYAKRDKDGNIIALYRQQTEAGLESIAATSPEVLAFLEQSDNSEVSQEYLKDSDLDLVRVMEDLVDLLVDKNVIMFTELPAIAQQKLLIRKKARANLQDDLSLVVDRSDIL